ncbi:hypothetical protein [Thermococcus henrietii]|uniref:hypothetical protein n=1 Tax=Thermococcus henrietii TaxID=2016361 RepID=UPI000C07CA20|nr:hypothetical protein [Thermococcus henrietii]
MLNLKPPRLATYLLTINGILLLGYAYYWSSVTYLFFGLLNLVLAYGVGRENRRAIKVALVYIAIEFFLALFYLISGDIYSAVDAAISFFIMHDILSYIELVYKEEKEAEEMGEKTESD